MSGRFDRFFMTNTVYATKLNMTQTWDKQGRRLPVTVVSFNPMQVTQVKTKGKDGYDAVQVGFGTKAARKVSKAVKGHLKVDGDITFRHLREVKVTDDTEVSVGRTFNLTDLVQVGDVVKVSGTSKGRGFAGGMKRWGFGGGPVTHGQSDRGRAPGSIGQGTTPGRVYKGKKMAGRYGNQRFTVENLLVVHLDQENNQIWIKGTIPGAKGSLVELHKTGTKPFEGLFTTEPVVEETQEAQATESAEAVATESETKETNTQS